MKELGWDFDIIVPSVEEIPLLGEDGGRMACRLANTKAESVRMENPDRWIIGADTVVISEGRILGKPSDFAEAVEMIRKLQGGIHTVVTGVALMAPDGRKLVEAERTKVKFRDLTDAEAASYVENGESYDKAGSYAIQGRGMLLVERIDGCYFNVVGLPLQRLSRMFADLGWPLSEQWRTVS